MAVFGRKPEVAPCRHARAVMCSTTAELMEIPGTWQSAARMTRPLLFFEFLFVRQICGSSPITGESGCDLEEEVVVVAPAGSVPGMVPDGETRNPAKYGEFESLSGR